MSEVRGVFAMPAGSRLYASWSAPKELMGVVTCDLIHPLLHCSLQ